MAIDVAALQRQLLGTFFEESFEGLELLESGLLALESAEGRDSTETINDIFRVAHSLKGGAGSFGLVDVGELGHALETLLEAFRAGKLAPNGELLSLLLESVDCMRGLLEALKAGTEPPRERSALLCARLTQAATRVEVAPTPAAAPEAPRRLGRSFRIVFKPQPSLLETGNEPVRLLRELSLLGALQCRADVSKVPPLSDVTPTDLKISWDMTLEGETTREEVLEVFSWVDQDAEIQVTDIEGGPVPATAPEAPAAATAPAVDAKEPALPAAAAAAELAKREQKSSEARDAGLGSIRVSVDKIDLLMNMVGELVITQSMLGELDSDEPLTAQRIERLREGLGQLARSTRSLQESVMSLRSMPISVVFNRFPRLVHDLSRQLSKQVELKIAGQTTELDKTVLEKLGDPLVHLVRNSMDHGLETPDERRAAGKTETGSLTLAAYHRGGDIVVEVRDDGRGINREKVLKRAREIGLVAEGATVTDELIRDLLFAPGFSTAAKVSDLSGRGVGMDVVRRNVRALGGEVFVDSTPGKGTCISLRLPLTLAIIDGQLIRLGQHTYVVPLLSIVESVEVERSRVGRVQGRAIYRLRDDLIPMIDLASVLGLHLGSGAPDLSLMVIVEADGERIGLMVSELLAQQQVVVKSLETNYGRIEGLAGATILGDGNVAFILDSGGIGRLIKSTQRDETRAA